MTLSTPICPACRFIRHLLWSTMDEIVFYSGPTPDHLPNCPARDPGTLLGMRVMTHIQLPDADPLGRLPR